MVAEGVVAAADNYDVPLFAPHWMELGTCVQISQIRAKLDSKTHELKEVT